MPIYSSLKGFLTEKILKYQRDFMEFNQRMNSIKHIKDLIRNYDVPKLTFQEIAEAKSYFKSNGYTLKNMYWHTFYKAVNGEFHKEYIPLDIFKTKISPRLNQKQQWPALLDKNLSYNLFKDFEQPQRVAQNINGFYYINDKLTNEAEVIRVISTNNKLLIIKPSLESGGGRMVTAFTVDKTITSHKEMSIKSLMNLYKKDFIVQEFLQQSEVMNLLNPTSLNTLRVMSYLNKDGVQILSTTSRMGSLESYTDNYSTGGILCGVEDSGRLKPRGYTKKGLVLDRTFTGIKFCDFVIPNYDAVICMVRSMHIKVPYFKIISWDIAINNFNLPVFIEYNTYNQGLEIQIPNGPLFGKFTDEILAKGLG